jgi:hypothetical protein
MGYPFVRQPVFCLLGGQFIGHIISILDKEGDLNSRIVEIDLELDGEKPLDVCNGYKDVIKGAHCCD